MPGRGALAGLALAGLAATRASSSESSGWRVSTIGGSGVADLRHTVACRAKDPEERRIDGPADSVEFAAPTRVQIVDGVVYVMDGMNGCIRTIEGGKASTATPCCTEDIATGTGHGQDPNRGTGAGPQDMHVAADHFYLLDSYNNQLKLAKRPFDKWVVIAGNGSRPQLGRSTDGPALAQALNEPHGMAVTSDGSGDVYIAETWSSCIRLLRRGVLTTVAGQCGTGGHVDGDPTAARFQHPHHINLDPRNESHLYVSDVECWDDDGWPDDQKHRPCAATDDGVCFSGIRKIELDRATGKALRVSTVAGKATHGHRKHDCNDWADGNATVARFDYIHGTAFQALSKEERASGETGGGSQYIYVCDEDNNMVRRVDLTTRETVTLAGSGKEGGKDGVGFQAEFTAPGGIGVDEFGSVYVGDYGQNRVRKLVPEVAPAAEGTEVLIIGAGWAGMSAAHILAQANVSFKVLEARNYTGGRTHAIQFGSASVGKFTMETGSGWLESSGESGGPEHAPPPVSAMAAKVGLKTAFVPGSTQNMSNCAPPSPHRPLPVRATSTCLSVSDRVVCLCTQTCTF